jgi:hypothetical protein
VPRPLRPVPADRGRRTGDHRRPTALSTQDSGQRPRLRGPGSVRSSQAAPPTSPDGVLRRRPCARTRRELLALLALAMAR